jgi:hypothetical protein
MTHGSATTGRYFLNGRGASGALTLIYGLITEKLDRRLPLIPAQVFDDVGGGPARHLRVREAEPLQWVLFPGSLAIAKQKIVRANSPSPKGRFFSID